MKFLIAVALLVVGLSPCPGFSQTSEAPTDGPVSVDRVEFSYTYSGVSINIYFNKLMENPYFYDDYRYTDNYYVPDFFDRVFDVPCILSQFAFRNTLTNEVFQAEYTGTCNSYRANIIQITMDHRDFLRLVVNKFIDTNSTMGLEMYTADMLGAPFNLRIEPDDAIECDVTFDLYYSNVFISGLDYWTDEGIVLIHFNVFIDIATVNTSKLSFSPYYNTVNITGGEILNQSPGLTLSVGIKLTSSDHDLLASKRLCTGIAYNCHLSVESGFAVSYFGVKVSPNSVHADKIRRAPTDFELVTMSIQLEYVGGLTLNLTLGLGQSFTIQYHVGEKIISVTCTSTSGDTNEHMNPMLEIDNGAVSIPANYIQNDWPNSTTLNAPMGLADSGLHGYHTCRTEGNTFLSRHILHSNAFHFFFYEGTPATADVGEDIVLRFAHGDFSDRFIEEFRSDRLDVRCADPCGGNLYFKHHIKRNTPFPFHGELHINRTRFASEGEYFITYDYRFKLRPNFVIDINCPCEQICTDLERGYEYSEGGYECSCREGYQLLPGGNCTDINECLVAAMNISAPDLCEPSMFCVNVEGNYSCECPAGTLLVEGVCEAESVLATTAAPPVTTVPDGTDTDAPPVTTVPDDTDTDAIPNAVVVEINGFTPSMFTLENQRRFREATADAVNDYCEDNECLVAYPQARARRNTLTADNIYIAGITSTGNSTVYFSLYARLGGGILSGSTLATAVLDHRDEYAALGFNVASVKLPTESTTILTTNQIIGIAVGVDLGLILILAVLLTCCVKHRSGQPKKGGDLTNVGTSLYMKLVPHEGLEEQAVGPESEEKEGDLDFERYKTIK